MIKRIHRNSCNKTDAKEMKRICDDVEGKVKAKDTMNDELNHNIEITEDDKEENKLLLKVLKVECDEGVVRGYIWV